MANNVKGWKVELDKPLVSSQAVTVEVDLILGNALEMYPAEIEQKDKQLVSNYGILIPINRKDFNTHTMKLPFPDF
jgi:hypothetical protein